MRTTLTVRTGPDLRRALEDRARNAGKSISDFVREILEEAVTQRPVGQRTAHLRGCLELPDLADAWRNQIRDRNWRP
jgi:hypothetical protein